MSETKSPGSYIRKELEIRGWTQEDLALILGRPKTRVNEIILGKQAVSVEVATDLASAFGTTAQLWLERESAFRLSLAKPGAEEIQRRSRLFQIGPVKELQKRGWVSATTDYGLLELEILQFFQIQSVDEAPSIFPAMRKSDPDSELTPSQKAWCFRVKHLAKALSTVAFREDNLNQCEQRLRKLAAYPQEARKIPGVLAEYGIRFVIVEPLSSGKVDGMTMWLNDRSPIIGMSLRFDRIDSFWHTLCHEFKHVRHKDRSVDSDVNQHDGPNLNVKSESEKRADAEASAMLIPAEELESFIKRVGPLYSKDRIIQFAHKIKIHPGIIVGQLQFRGEIGYSANREMLVKVRNTITPAAVTDGWGHTIDPRALK